MRKAFGGFFVLFLGLQAHAASFHPYFGWRTIDTSHFSIHYHHRLEEVAQKSARYLEEAHEKLSPKYQWKPWGRTQVLLTDNLDEANGMASTLPYNWMLLRVVPPHPDNSLNTYDDWLKVLITHEYTHILHLDAYSGFWRPFRLVLGKIVNPAGLTPGWIKEGTATLEETLGSEGGRGRASTSDMLLRTAILYDKFPTIDRAGGAHWKWPGSQTQYIFGVKFLQYLKDRFGEDKLQQFHRKTQRSLFVGAVNKQAKKIFGKSFYRLWEEWQTSLIEDVKTWEYKAGKEDFTETQPFLSGKDSYSLPTFSRDGKKLAYASVSPKRAPRLIVRDMETGKEKIVVNKLPTQISFSPDGDRLVFSTIATHERFYFYYDLFQVDLTVKKPKAHRLTRGARARDPDWSPDGKKIIFVSGEAGTDQIKIYEVESKQITTLVSRVKPYTQFAQPRYSPDGSQIVLLRFLEKEGWQVCLSDAEGRAIQKIDQPGLSVVSHPVWMPDGKTILYSSDEDGVSNLYRYHLATKTKTRITNIKTGLFEPVVGPEGEIVAKVYMGEGFEIAKLPFNVLGSKSYVLSSKKEKGEKNLEPGTLNLERSSKEKEHRTWNIEHRTIKKYSPFRSSLFLPRYVAPGFFVLDNGLLLSAVTGSSDPLQYHNWLAGGTYRTDAKYLGYFGRYTYNRFRPIFGLGIDDFAVDFGNLTFDDTRNTYHFFEERRRGTAFVSMPLGKGHGAGLSYFYEDRMPVTNILALESAALNLGIYAGAQFNYFYSSTEKFPASISFVEKGRLFRGGFGMTDHRLGANRRNEQKIMTGDFREFFPLGNRHVVALRVAGGVAVGDRIQPGTFSFGGSLGEGTLGGEYSSRYYSFRGLPVGSLISERVMTSSLEYRLPLFSPQRGLGTWPLFLNNCHLALFTDQGNGWNNTPATFGDFFDNFFVSGGLETRADFVVGHGLPVTGRMGYAVILVNRDRLGNLRDPFLNNLVKNGIFILQFGTSF